MKGQAILPAGSGVYSIRHIESGRVYIGSSVRARTRAQEHVRELRRGAHANVYLQRAWNAHGADQFEIVLIESGDNDADIRAIERRHIVSLNASDPRYGFNMATAALENFGHSVQTRAALSKLLIGHKRNVGKSLSEEHKAKISAAQKGRRKSPEQVEKVASKLRGRKCTPEAIAKRSAALKGLPKSDEWRAKVSAKAKARGAHIAIVAAARLANLGRKQTPESIAARLEGKKRAKAARAILECSL